MARDDVRSPIALQRNISPTVSSGSISARKGHSLMGEKQDGGSFPLATAAAHPTISPPFLCPSSMRQHNTSHSHPGNSQNLSLLEAEQARSSPDDTPTPQSGSFSYGGGSMSKESLLSRVQLAMEVVQAAAEIRPLTPLEESDTYQRHEADLTDLGVELYKLFSGQDYDELEDFALEDDLFDAPSGNEGQQRRKRERRHPGEATRAYAPLRDLGMPVALCRVVSSLMDSNSVDCGDGNGCYESILEVVEELRVLAEEPDKFLFHENSTGELRIPHHVLYGRDEETSMLLGAFDRATSTNTSTGPIAAGNMVLVSGYSGAGKSSLVHGLRSTFVERGACFVSGKFDAMRQPRPLSAIVSALDDYCDILSQDGDRIDSVREALAATIGSEGAVLAGLIPNLRKLFPLGNSAPMQISGREALQRILFMFRMLFWATCSKAHPVVLFLDDLQWADEISLELMQVLVTDTMVEGLLFVGSYRDNEVGADHLLTTHLGSIRQSGAVAIVPIHTTNLDSRSINRLVSETLHLTPRTTRSLADVVTKKTGGNALFAVQFLTTLYDEGLLHFSLTSRRWEWDIDQIRSKGIADNVVELMTAKLLRLAPEVQEALCVAAGFGATCHESLLNIIDRSSDRMMSTTMALDVAVAEGLMVKSGGSYHFCHDQIQRASYELIPESKREVFHLRIGRSIWKLSSEEETEQYLFVIADQLHRGSSLITDCDEKIQLAQLSLLAAEMATIMSGFLTAAAYLNAGIDLLVDEDWEQHRQLCFDLHNSGAETLYVLGDFEGMASHIEVVLLKANHLPEKLKALFILVSSSGAQGRAKDAINTTMSVLQQLGEPFPADVNDVIVKQEMMKTQQLLETKKGLLDELELMVDTSKLEALKLMRKATNYMFTENRQYYILVACRMVQLTLLYGVSKCSDLGFASLGSVLCFVGDVSGGLKLGRLALSIADKFQDRQATSEVKMVVYSSIYMWTQPMQAMLPVLKESIDTAMSFGNKEFAIISMSSYAATAFFSGQPLGALMDELQLHANKISTGYQKHPMRAMFRPLRQTILNLLGRSGNAMQLIGEEMNENLLDLSEESGLSLQYYYYRMYLEYMFGEYELCWQSSKCNRESISKGAAGRFHIMCNYTFYSGLAALALARVEVKSEYTETISRAMAQMEKWIEFSPWNCEHKLGLMKAEYAYLQGDIVVAAKEYDAAADTAAKHSFQHEQAIALERAGVFYLEFGNHDVASRYFVRAHDCYCQWGAISKAAQVKEMYL